MSAHDDPSIPALTVRAFIIGIVYVAAGAFINQFFSIRQPGITVSSNVAQLLAYPVGKACETLPDWGVILPFYGTRVSLNPLVPFILCVARTKARLQRPIQHERTHGYNHYG